MLKIQYLIYEIVQHCSIFFKQLINRQFIVDKVRVHPNGDDSLCYYLQNWLKCFREGNVWILLRIHFHTQSSFWKITTSFELALILSWSITLSIIYSLNMSDCLNFIRLMCLCSFLSCAITANWIKRIRVYVFP